MDLEVLQCKQCGCKKSEKEFFRYQGSNKRFNICKDCLRSQFDPDHFDTFLWILKELDVPFIEDEWYYMLGYHHDKTLLGRYLAKMGLYGFKNYKWEDSTSCARDLGLQNESYLKSINQLVK